MEITMSRLSHTPFVSLLPVCLALNACQEAAYTKPELAETLMTQYETLHAFSTCHKKLDSMRDFLDRHEAQLQQERQAFDAMTRPPSSQTIRDTSYVMLAAARLEVLLRPCAGEDPDNQLPAIFDRLHTLTGMTFSLPDPENNAP